MTLRATDYFFFSVFVVGALVVAYAGTEPRAFAASRVLIHLAQFIVPCAFVGFVYFIFRFALKGLKRDGKLSRGK